MWLLHLCSSPTVLFASSVYSQLHSSLPTTCLSVPAPGPSPPFPELIQNPLKSTEDLLLPSKALGSALQFLFKAYSLHKAFSYACLCCLTHSQSELFFFSSATSLQCFVRLIFWVSVKGYNQMAALDLFRVFGKVTSLLAIGYPLLSLCAALGYICIARV